MTRQRHEAISPFQSWQTDKREIASQARNDSRGREKRGDLGCSGMANREKRDCFAGSPLSVIARNEAISVVQGWQTDKREIASQARNDRNLPRFARNDKKRPARNPQLALTLLQNRVYNS
jgi:hypothetical protein